MTPVNSSARKSTASQIEVLPFKAALGALVRCGDVRNLDNSSFSEVYRAYLDHLVLLIRDQHINDAELLGFGRRFGDLVAASPVHVGQKPRDEKHPELAVISNVIENGMAIGGLGDGEAVWHTDSSFYELPPTASILYSLEIPPTGGDTGFANMYLAFDTMPADLRNQITGKTIKHDKRYTAGGQLRHGYTGKEDLRTSAGTNHPIVRRHDETGYPALYLGRRPHAYVNGLPLEESEALLDALWAHAAKPEFAWHHQWRVGDILIWDNRCVMHRRDAFDPQSRRVLHRTQCKGKVVVDAKGGGKDIAHARGHLHAT